MLGNWIEFKRGGYWWIRKSDIYCNNICRSRLVRYFPETAEAETIWLRLRRTPSPQAVELRLYSSAGVYIPEYHKHEVLTFSTMRLVVRHVDAGYKFLEAMYRSKQEEK